ncbi:MAG: dihydrodipicolinate synthase family protein [Planctomycetes bacterium]|nr:dihydrodipicolinate synthase family protein [Planctomycetota bacterium]
MAKDGALHTDGFKQHIDQQFASGIYGVLICGTMGRMQLLSDAVYRDAVKFGSQFCAGKGETFIGVGDASLPRTLDRIRYVEQFDIDGVVVLSPYLFKPGQQELIDYFTAVADRSTKPVYLYDLPVLSGVKLENETVLKLSKHPSIYGAKCSDKWEDTRSLMEMVDDDFRIIPAQPFLVDQLVYMGVESNLDGVFSICPELICEIVKAAENRDYMTASKLQKDLSAFLLLMRKEFPLLDAFSAILNSRGVEGELAMSPARKMDELERERLFNLDFVKRMLNQQKTANI